MKKRAMNDDSKKGTHRATGPPQHTSCHSVTVNSPLFFMILHADVSMVAIGGKEKSLTRDERPVRHEPHSKEIKGKEKF